MVEYTFYTDTYKGHMSEAEFTTLEPQASDVISLLISTDATAPYSEYVQKAVCYQIDYMSEHGTVEVTSESSGSYSVQKRLTILAGVPVSPMAMNLIHVNGPRSKWL